MHHKRQAAGRVTRCCADLQAERAESEDVAVSNVDVGLRLAGGRDDTLARRDALLQHAGSGHVIGVHVRVQRVAQLQVEVPDDAQISLDEIDDGVDDDGFLRLVVGQEVRIGVREVVEKLPEEEVVYASAGTDRADPDGRDRRQARSMNARFFQSPRHHAK